MASAVALTRPVVIFWRLRNHPALGFSSEGTSENSPAFQRRITNREGQVPKGRLNSEASSVPGTRLPSALPGVETPGYPRKSLRD